MDPQIRSLAWALAGMAMGVGGWLATLWAASERWAGVARFSISVLLIAAAFRGRFAGQERARDFWAGFALFGLVHLIVASPNRSQNPMLSAVIDRIGDGVMGVDGAFPGGRRSLTPLGLAIARLPVDHDGGLLWDYLPYVRANSRRFGGLALAAIGGFDACPMRRRAVQVRPKPRLAGCPLLGIAWLYLVGGLIGGTFVLHAHPELKADVGVFAICPGSEAANFALFNVELLAVLFAALEARFGSQGERPWWIGFALFGGAHLLSSEGPLTLILPTNWPGDLFLWAYDRYVSDSHQPSVTVRGMVLMDYETGMFFRSGLIWSPLAGFLPIAWLGTLAARLARRLSEPSTRPGFLERLRTPSSIGRLMVVLAAVGWVLAAAKDPNVGKVTMLGNAIAALLLFAALRASFGPRPLRAWWWGFAMLGGVDLLVGSDRNGLGSPRMWPSSGWPIHEEVSRLHRVVFEGYVGQSVPALALFESLDDPMLPIYDAFLSSRNLLLLALCLPMGWIGATLAAWLDRRAAVEGRPIGPRSGTEPESAPSGDRAG